MKRRAVFLDRDGTLIEEVGYLSDLDRLILFPYSIDSIRLLNRAGFAVVVVTNQAGIARGIVAEHFVGQAHAALSARIEAGGGRVDAYYYCPHHPQGIVEPFNRECECRKPATGMWRRAASELDVDLAGSFTVGDRWLDVEAGRAAGTRTVLVRTGYGSAQQASMPSEAGADAIVENLAAAVSWILQAETTLDS